MLIVLCAITVRAAVLWRILEPHSRAQGVLDALLGTLQPVLRLPSNIARHVGRHPAGHLRIWQLDTNLRGSDTALTTCSMKCDVPEGLAQYSQVEPALTW